MCISEENTDIMAPAPLLFQYFSISSASAYCSQDEVNFFVIFSRNGGRVDFDDQGRGEMKCDLIFIISITCHVESIIHHEEKDRGHSHQDDLVDGSGQYRFKGCNNKTAKFEYF